MKDEDSKNRINDIIIKEFRRKRIKHDWREILNLNDDLFDSMLIVNHMTFIDQIFVK